MEKSLDYKLEGDVVKITVNLAESLDLDKDGVPSIKMKNVTNLDIDGSELLSELMKSNKLFEKAAKMVDELKAKFGGNGSPSIASAMGGEAHMGATAPADVDTNKDVAHTASTKSTGQIASTLNGAPKPAFEV